MLSPSNDPGNQSPRETIVPMRLVEDEGGKLVTRSQAKRLTHVLEPHECVELDFAGITDIGQAFADELFRVFANAHPQIRITPLNASPAVAQMIRRAVAARAAQAPQAGSWTTE